MANLAQTIRKAARGNWTVLIQGESGTGKGMVARAIHRLSKQSSGPLIIVNCGGIPDNLVESELFGYERGAFTGADRSRKGKFEAAHTGTIFLDEIGELSLASQTRLLHVLQDREIERLGGEGRRIPLDVRVIAATNRNLEQRVAEGAFREDLFFRLNVFAIHTPSLRERPEDVPALAQHFAQKAILQDVLKLLQAHPWPGNVRQLENVVQRAVAVGETDEVTVEDLPVDFVMARQPSLNRRVRRFHQAMDDAARQLCIDALTASKGDLPLAARLLGLHRNSVYRLVRKYGIR